MAQLQNYNHHDDQFLNSIQHQLIDQNINTSSKDINRAINNNDNHLSAGICSLSRDVNEASTSVKDMVDRQSVALKNKMDVSADSTQNAFRDVQVSVERANLNGANNSDRNAAQILNAIATFSGDVKVGALSLNAETRAQQADQTRDIISSVQSAKDQANNNQMAMIQNFNDQKYEALRIAKDAEAKLAECCCELKQRIDKSECNILDAMKNQENQRLRDTLNQKENKLNFLKYCSDRGNSGGGGRGPP